VTVRVVTLLHCVDAVTCVVAVDVDDIVTVTRDVVDVTDC
jgi:hypothetical protein